MAFVDNAIDANSGTIRAHAVVPNPDGFLTPGLFGRARLLGSGEYRAVLVEWEHADPKQVPYLNEVRLALGRVTGTG